MSVGNVRWWFEFTLYQLITHMDGQYFNTHVCTHKHHYCPMHACYKHNVLLFSFLLQFNSSPITGTVMG